MGDEAWPEVPATSAVSAREPRPKDGIDYVLEPGERAQEPSRVWGAVSSALSRRAPTEPGPLEMLRERTPIDTMIKRHRLGLHHALKVGANIMDYLGNGYSWRDLLRYEDIGRMGAERATQALRALGTDANHFRAYPSQMPWSEVRKHCGLETSDLNEQFGLHFPPDGPLECNGSEEWSASDVLRLGVQMDDLLSFGMTYRGQYADLMHGLSSKRAAQLEAQLGATARHVSQLIDETNLARDSEPTPAPAAVRTRAPAEAAKREGVATAAPVGPLPPPSYLKRAEQRRLIAGTVGSLLRK